MRLSIGIVALAALSACEMAPSAGAPPESGAVETAAPAAETPAQRVIERDVEAPDVFQRQEAGLWDGRPSLGGVWVAHPNATDPERVVIRNTRTGATVIGALFRRERDNPGPRFQISSEAAGALGILAGAPSEISVTALRLQRVEMEIAPTAAPATAAAETLAVAPVAPVETPTPTDAAPASAVAVTEVDPAPRRTLRDFFRGTPAQPETAAIAETTLAPVAPLAETAATTASSTQTMTELTSAEPEPPRRSLRDFFRRDPAPEPDTTPIPLPETTATAAPASPPPAAPAPAAARIAQPFVQIGIFSVESNAENARGMMQRAGLNAEIRRGRAGENQFWRVVVGPAASTEERAGLLTRVRGLGFADAYAVAR